MNTNLIIAGIVLVLCGYGYFEHNRFIKARLELNTFVATTEALQAKQERDNAQAINNALTERDAAIKLRDQARANLVRVSLTAENTSRVCYRPDELNRAYREFVEEIRAIAGIGQDSIIDNKAWSEAWPR